MSGNKIQAQLIFELFQKAGDSGLTSGEAAEQLGLPLGSVSTRISQLCRACCLIETPRSRKGLNKTHRSTKAVIYQVDPSAEFSMYTKYVTAMGPKLRGESPVIQGKVSTIQEEISRGVRNLVPRVNHKKVDELVARSHKSDFTPAPVARSHKSGHKSEPIPVPVVRSSEPKSEPTPVPIVRSYRPDQQSRPSSPVVRSPKPGQKSRPASELEYPQLGSWEVRVLHAADAFRRNPSRRNKRRLLTVSRFLV